MRTQTAHNITRTGLAKVAGRHLSDAANEPPVLTQEQRDLAAMFAGPLESDAKREERRYERALREQIQRQGSAL